MIVCTSFCADSSQNNVFMAIFKTTFIWNEFIKKIVMILGATIMGDGGGTFSYLEFEIDPKIIRIVVELLILVSFFFAWIESFYLKVSDELIGVADDLFGFFHTLFSRRLIQIIISCKFMPKHTSFW